MSLRRRLQVIEKCEAMHCSSVAANCGVNATSSPVHASLPAASYPGAGRTFRIDPLSASDRDFNPGEFFESGYCLTRNASFVCCGNVDSQNLKGLSRGQIVPRNTSPT